MCRSQSSNLSDELSVCREVRRRTVRPWWTRTLGHLRSSEVSNFSSGMYAQRTKPEDSQFRNSQSAVRN
jgi:hypothetical protein